MSGEHNPFGRVSGVWDDIVADMEATAAEYREDGWDVLELHPGDVETVTGRQFGFDVVLPGEEFDAVAEAVADGEFSRDQVFRNDAGGMALFLLVLEDPDREQAICCPAYYEHGQVEDLWEDAERAGAMYTHLTDLSRENVVTFTHDDPARFF
jgi:hypothetical protein